MMSLAIVIVTGLGLRGVHAAGRKEGAVFFLIFRKFAGGFAVRRSRGERLDVEGMHCQ